MKALRCLAVLLIVLIGNLAGGAAHAAVTCTASVTSIVKGYDPNATGDTVATGSYTVSCTRLASDPNTFNWQLGADNGIHNAGAQNRVQMGAAANRYNYELYRLTPYTNANRWQDAAATRFTGTINFGAGLIASQSGSFDLRLPGPQTVDPAGTYTDTVTVTVRNGSGTMLSQTTFNISIITIASCTLSTPPGNINLAYTSFQVAAASASTNFGVNCTTGIPYTMALDATSGTLVGLNYTVALSQSASNGTGVAQTFSINGSIAAGQSGTCATASCSASATRTLTITY
jgi:spore coat protein U-like protein